MCVAGDQFTVSDELPIESIDCLQVDAADEPGLGGEFGLAETVHERRIGTVAKQVASVDLIGGLIVAVDPWIGEGHESLPVVLGCKHVAHGMGMVGPIRLVRPR